MTRKTLLLGSTGFLGRELKEALALTPNVLAPTRAELDLTDLEALREYIAVHQPIRIINAAGICGASECDSHPELARQLNSELPQALAEASCQIPDCTLVHFSSVDVYADARLPQGQNYYTEDCQVHPKSVYAKTKLQGDLAISSVASNYLVFRLSALYDAYRLFAIEDRDPVSIGAPTAVQYIANTVVRSLGRIERRVLRVHSGIYHLSSKGDADWQTFYREVSLQQQKTGLLATSQSPALVTPGPKLSVEKVEDAFCLFIPTWQSQLKTYLSQGNQSVKSG